MPTGTAPGPTVVFLDRDGTIIRDVHYLARAEDVELLPGAAHAIAQLNARRTPVVVITNQSGIARGRLSSEDYLRTERRLADLLAAQGATIDATYYCPHHPDYTGPCDCRKPGVAMFERAAREHGLDTTSPAFVGDRWRDIDAFHSLGGTPVLIATVDTPADDLVRARTEGVHIVDSLAHAVELLLSGAHTEMPVPQQP